MTRANRPTIYATFEGTTSQKKPLSLSLLRLPAIVSADNGVASFSALIMLLFINVIPLSNNGQLFTVKGA